MNLKKRFGLYGIGFALGIAMVIFFLNGKNAGCEYFPNARILKLIREKPLQFSMDSQQAMRMLEIDSLSINKLLLNGEIDFSKSITHQKPCRFYWIEGIANKKEVVLYVKNCKDLATVESINLKE
ncbi:MAG: hypothetical protein L3J45_06390 [Flavobacteriaceae bacterium]|nr:hypothetical protein [Flavobacteriaceae bacterium]